MRKKVVSEEVGKTGLLTYVDSGDWEGRPRKSPNQYGGIATIPKGWLFKILPVGSEKP